MARLTSMSTALCGLLAAVSLSSCSLRLPVEDPPLQRSAVALKTRALTPHPRDPELLIWMTADRYHTGLVVPYDWLIESGFIPPRDFGMPRYVAMSWGNRDAYSEAGFDHPWKVFRVLFTPTPSVMEFIAVDWHVAEVIPQQRIWRRLVPRHHGPDLAHFLNGCLKHDANGIPVVVSKSSWGEGVQLECRHSYFIPRVCNVWTLQALEATGCEFNAWLGLTASGLIRQAEKPGNDLELIWPGGGAPTTDTDS